MQSIETNRTHNNFLQKRAHHVLRQRGLQDRGGGGLAELEQAMKCSIDSIFDENKKMQQFSGMSKIFLIVGPFYDTLDKDFLDYQILY